MSVLTWVRETLDIRRICLEKQKLKAELRECEERSSLVEKPTLEDVKKIDAKLRELKKKIDEVERRITCVFGVIVGAVAGFLIVGVALAVPAVLASVILRTGGWVYLAIASVVTGLTRHPHPWWLRVVVWVGVPAAVGAVVLGEAMNWARVQELENRLTVMHEAKAEELMQSPEDTVRVPPPKPTGQLRISSPSDGDQLPFQGYIKGTVGDSDAEVWVLVHPLDHTGYWVQRRADVSWTTSSWKAMVFLGRGDSRDVGKEFEVVAVANPTAELVESEILGEWPGAQWTSNAVTVIRK